ncbi:TonB-dependent receptor [Chitinophaga nivalis]|uniref:TonB-dependent receptor plug domain-containing protein n=1 Tax=Chitinophaga nivalis TaxID=2991709 RepID=A0ABT3IGG4_9BACT|nr:TonB-dependent receptor plug domain-containing protein [Chitinophaga nivalis]MCW3467264.1 TonB-dependent receptor plug domain-containing protein [Chitinophaga nivalis]MCW3483044.1 TonB-dependent receptor plug domain-containing protein [Chitinophaga nivalis]
MMHKKLALLGAGLVGCSVAFAQQAAPPEDTSHTWVMTTPLTQIVVNAPRIEKEIMHVDLKMTPVNTAQDLLRKVPGLFIAQHAGGGKAEQIFLRGFDCDHGTDINVSADGIPVNIVSHAHGQGYADLHFLIPETIEGIDFGKGAYYADKGDLNTAGYVNFSTYNHISNNMVKLEGGAFNTMRAVGMFNLLGNEDAGKRNAYIATEYNYTNGPFDVRQNFNRVNVLAKYNQWLNEKDYIGIQFSTFTSGWNASGQIPERAVKDGIISRWGSIDPTEGGNTSRSNVALTYKRLINETEDWQSFFYYSRYKFNLYSDFTFFLHDPVYGDEIQQKDDRSIYGFDHTYTKRFNLPHSNITWQSGAGIRLDDIHNLELNHVYQRDSLLNREAYGTAMETNLQAYTGIEWRKGKWMINPAVRIDHFIFNYHDKLQSIPAGQDQEGTRVSPKLNFVYTASAVAQWYLKTGMGFHSNDVRVVMQQQGKDILPYSVGGDLGVILKPAKNLIIQPALWYLYLQQEFVYVGDEAVVEPSGKTKRMGADLSIRYQPLSWLYVDADINYAHGRFVDEPKATAYIPLAPVLTSTGGIAVKLPIGFSANLRYRYMKERPAIEDNSVTAKGYFVNDLALAYTQKRWEFTVQAQNLFNVNWNEAQFETTTRLRNEQAPVSELCFTPGMPFYLKAGVAVKF